METVTLYQPVSHPDHYFYRYRDLKEEYGNDYATLLCFRKNEQGFPLVNEDPLAVGGFFRKEASSEEKKILMSKALLNYREPAGPTPGQMEAERYREGLWKNLWTELTAKTTRYD